MEYFIEEKDAEMPTINRNDIETKSNNNKKKIKLNNEFNNPIYLAEMFHIKPEYFEFVRKHAINGGTGKIEFPTQEDVNLSKRPRFVSTVSQNFLFYLFCKYLYIFTCFYIKSTSDNSNEIKFNKINIGFNKLNQIKSKNVQSTKEPLFINEILQNKVFNKNEFMSLQSIFFIYFFKLFFKLYIYYF